MNLFKISKLVEDGFKWVGTFKNWVDLFDYKEKHLSGVLVLVERFYHEVPTK